MQTRAAHLPGRQPLRSGRCPTSVPARGMPAPIRGAPAAIRALQQIAGNAAVSKFLADRPVLARVKDLAGGGRVHTSDDVEAKRQTFLKVMRNIEAEVTSLEVSLVKANTEDAQKPILKQIELLNDRHARLSEHLETKHAALLPGTEAFESVMPPQEPVEPEVLHLDPALGNYRVGNAVAEGEFQFVIRRNSPHRVLMTKGGGHQAIAGEDLVYYAGTAKFDAGRLSWWNNNTGHYKTDSEHRSQAEIPKAAPDLPYLPLALFVPFQPVKAPVAAGKV